MTELPYRNIVKFNMYKLFPTLFVATLFAMTLMPVYADQVHKWVDDKGVTHYSDKAPVSSASQVTVVEVSAMYSTTTDVEDDYYSITNQWMRIHKERIEREKIKLEKAKQRAAQRPVAPQVVYLNDPYEGRYGVGYPFYFYNNKYRRHRSHGNSNRRFRDKSNEHYGDKRARHDRRGRSEKLQGQGRGRGTHSHRNASGATLKIR